MTLVIPVWLLWGVIAYLVAGVATVAVWLLTWYRDLPLGRSLAGDAFLAMLIWPLSLFALVSKWFGRRGPRTHGKDRSGEHDG